jgi:trehalose utilization protein
MGELDDAATPARKCPERVSRRAVQATRGEHLPEGVHRAVAKSLREQLDMEARAATLDEPEHGLTDEVLSGSDVPTWWEHDLHDQADDEIVEKVYGRVVGDRMGLILLHPSHCSTIFKRLLGTTGNLKWRTGDDTERIWVIEPGHPVAEGPDEYIDLPEEMPGERFDVPKPETLVFISWFSGGGVFRSGYSYTRARGKVFYFRPGHGEHPIYHNPEIQRVIANAVRWAAPTKGPAPWVGAWPP